MLLFRGYLFFFQPHNSRKSFMDLELLEVPQKTTFLGFLCKRAIEHTMKNHKSSKFEGTFGSRQSKFYVKNHSEFVVSTLSRNNQEQNLRYLRRKESLKTKNSITRSVGKSKTSLIYFVSLPSDCS